jgi:hypothetical protein
MSRPRLYKRLRRMLSGWNKADLVNHLGELHGHRNYLEICTAVSGYRFSEIDRDIFAVRHRLGYRGSALHSDGSAYDFSTEALDSSECVSEIRARGLQYDVILVDSWHEYETSFRDLNDAVSLLSGNGTVVVHDCLPKREDLVQMPFKGGEWSGVTYRAFLDFAIQRALDYRVVDTDFGCGIIRKGIPAGTLPPERRAMLEAWAAIGDDHAAAYRFLQRHLELWNVISVPDFLTEEARLSARVGTENQSNRKAG